MKRVSAVALMALAETMTTREQAIVKTVSQLRLVMGSQLERLYFTGLGKTGSRQRAARRTLASLTDRHVLYRLERRIGGVRAGSAGHIYGLGPIGKRLSAYWQGHGLVSTRASYEPGAVFVRHTLAVAEQYVRLREAEQAGHCELLDYQSEPICWRPSLALGRSKILKPDAYVRLGVGNYEERSFLEVDLGSEGRGSLTAKCLAYISYFQTGREQAEHGVFPRVLWVANNQARVRLLIQVCMSLPPEQWQLFQVVPVARATEALMGVNGEYDPEHAGSNNGKIY
jgi:hypothetical protein